MRIIFFLLTIWNCPIFANWQLTVPATGCPFRSGVKPVEDLLEEISRAAKQLEQCPEVAAAANPFSQIVTQYEKQINSRFKEQTQEIQSGRAVIALNCFNLDLAPEELNWFSSLVDQNLPLPANTGYSAQVQNPDPKTSKAERQSQLAMEFGSKIRTMQTQCQSSRQALAQTRQQVVANSILNGIRPSYNALLSSAKDCANNLKSSQSKTALMNMAIQVSSLVSAFQPYSTAAATGFMLGGDFLAAMSSKLFEGKNVWSTGAIDEKSKFESAVCALKKIEKEWCAHLPKTPQPFPSPVAKTSAFKNYLEGPNSVAHFTLLADEFKEKGSENAEPLLDKLHSALTSSLAVPMSMKKNATLLDHLTDIGSRLNQLVVYRAKDNKNLDTLRHLSGIAKSMNAFTETAKAWISENDVAKKVDLGEKVIQFLEGTPAGQDDKGKNKVAVPSIDFRAAISEYWKLSKEGSDVEKYLNWELSKNVLQKDWRTKRLAEYGLAPSSSDPTEGTNIPEMDPSRNELSNGFSRLITQLKDPIGEFLPQYQNEARTNSGQSDVKSPRPPNSRPIMHAMASAFDKMRRDRAPAVALTTTEAKAKYFDEHMMPLLTACVYLAGAVVWEKGGQHFEASDTALSQHGNALKLSLRDYYEQVCARFECKGNGIAVFRKESSPGAVQEFSKLRCEVLSSADRKIRYLRTDYLTKNQCNI